MTKKLNKTIFNDLETQIKKRNKITALAGLGGILLGLGSTTALAPEEAKLQAQRKVENFIYQTSQIQDRAMTGRVLEDLIYNDPPGKILKEPLYYSEESMTWEVKRPSLEVVKILEPVVEETSLKSKAVKNYSDSIIDPSFISYIIQIESSGNPKAVGSSGERGLMQIMRNTWHDSTTRIYGIPISFDKAFKPEENIKAGIAQLEWLEQSYLPQNIPNWENLSDKTRRDSIIAAYNIGVFGFLKNYQGNPYHKNLPQITKDYISKVNALVYGKKQVAPTVHQWAGLIKEVFED